MNIFVQFLSKCSLVFMLLGITAITPLVGCGSGDMRSVTDNADAQAIADYERMVAEAEEKANAENAN
jgi:hypothetical protein